MGKDCGPWFPSQQFNLQSDNVNHFRAPLILEQQSSYPFHMKAGTDVVSRNGTLPMCLFPEQTHSGFDQVNETCAWFYNLPHFKQAFAPALNHLSREKIHAVCDVNCKDASVPRDKSGCDDKKFLVFDHSVGQTKLIFSSKVGTSCQSSTPLNPKKTSPEALIRDDNVTKVDLGLGMRTISPDDVGGNSETDRQSEMHEDTEELNALLYSDDDSDYTEDDDGDEVTSTGHSPSTMTATQFKPLWRDQIIEDVASSDDSTGKRKLFDTDHGDGWSVKETASCVKPETNFECEDDAESRCEFNIHMQSEMILESRSKRMKKDSIYETLCILENIIPGGKGKNATSIIDEAIVFLKSLKNEAKALGLDTP